MRTWMYFEINTDDFSESAIKKSYYKLNKEFGVFGIMYNCGGVIRWSSNGESSSKSVRFYKLSLKTSFSLS